MDDNLKVPGDPERQSKLNNERTTTGRVDKQRRTWLLRGLAILLAVTPFVVLELTLRLAHRRQAGDAVDLDPVVDLQQLKPLFELDAAGEHYQIPQSRRNFFQPAAFPADKATGTQRIFVLGGSTVQGRPYAPETAFSTWLRLRLQAADPDINFEVVNCGGVSYASYRLARLLPEVLNYQPDAIIVYTGHNEFLEQRSYAEVRDFGPTRSLISRVGSKLRTVSWLRSQFVDDTNKRTLLPMEVDARLDHPGGLEDYHRDEVWRSGVEQHFAWTLEQIVELAEQAQVPLLLCSPASDVVNTPPLKIEHQPGLNAGRQAEFDAWWQQVRDEQLASDRRVDAALRCLAIDRHHAGANYIAGRMLYDAGKASLAKAYLEAARDADVCPLRATGPIIQAVTDIAQRHHVPVIQTTALLDQRSSDGTRIPDGIADPELFIDHVHPTIVGHQIIAAALADALQPWGWTSPDPGAQQRYQRLVEAHMSTLGEAYFARGRERLEGLRRWATGRAGELGIPSVSPANATASPQAL